MTLARKHRGVAGERLAREFLENLGYEFVAANARSPFGEIDLVMRDRDCLVFVEVKARRDQAAGLPQEAVTPAKLGHFTKAATWFAREREVRGPWRLDVVAVEGERISAHLRNITG